MKHLKTFENNIKTLYLWYKDELYIVPENGIIPETEEEKSEMKMLNMRFHMMTVIKKDITKYLEDKSDDVIDNFFKSLIKFYPKKYTELYKEYELGKITNKYNL